MLKKTLKIIIILIMLGIFSISFVYATDVNLNLPSTENDPLFGNSVGNPNDSTSTDTPTDIQNLLNSMESNAIQDETNLIDDDNLGTNPSETLQPSGVSNAPESGLGVSNIINILLITVGVILILLAIAILIRVKG